ncbi:hypothetical protein H8E07_11735 [bacterium]|nr:hypothetical protein [bacterium]
MRPLICSACLLSLLAPLASGQRLPPPQSPDVIGLYFDLEYYENCVDVAFLGHAYAWLVVSNQTHPMLSLDCRVDMVPETFYVAFWQMDEAWTNTVDAPDFACQALAGPVVGEQVVVAMVDILMLDVTNPVEIFIHPPEGGTTPHYGTESGLTIPLTGSSGSNPDIPVAFINSWCSVIDAVEPMSWSAVKSLYR